jgi:hypothetical protein
MGCGESAEDIQQDKENAPIYAKDVFLDLKLGHLITPQMHFENKFEKDLFMAINILRSESRIFSNIVR